MLIDESERRKSNKPVSHWRLTVWQYQILSYPITLPLLIQHHVADALRFLVFAALNVIFSLNHNDYSSDYTLYGWLTIANGGLALLMAPRTNLFALILRIPSPLLLQYHRWIGTATVAHATVHISFNLQHFSKINQIADNFAATRIRVGLMAWISLAIILITALPIVRRQRFEIFYYAHFLFIAFVIGALIHADKGPEFLLPGFCLWVVDRAIRFWNNFRQARVQSVTQYPGALTKINISGVKVRRPGQVVFVQIPAVSHINWHPFSVASAPGASDTTIAIRGLGEYTKRVQTVGSDDKEGGVSPVNQFKVRVDGPYGVGRLGWGRLPVTVLVAGGIGITPGMGIVSHIVKNANSQASSRQPSPDDSKSFVHLLWVVKDHKHIAWFQDELRSLGDLIDHENSNVSLDVSIHVTEATSIPAAAELDESREPDNVSTMIHNITAGRPSLSAWFSQIKQLHPGLDAEVHICGPRGLVTEARKASIKVSDTAGIFYVEEESFEF